MTHDAAADDFVRRIATDWRRAGLGAADATLCAYAERLTREPAAMADDDIVCLRDHDFDDAAIHDATQVIAYFNYINRVAEALDVAQESFVRAWDSRVQ